jgi:hypothetical protein
MKKDRIIEHHYADPLDGVWLETARRCGLVVVRDEAVFASFDGAKTLTICTPEHFDQDDCLAQMILHELCHALIMGAGGAAQRDWGLENVDDQDAVFEHACHRLQATLADRHGLRAMLAPTTDYRAYYDRLPRDPLAAGADPAIALAIDGWDRARHGPWAQALEDGLSATGNLALAVRDHQDAGSLWSRYQKPHRLGLPPGSGEVSCGGCAWSGSAAAGATPRCTVAPRAMDAPPPDVGIDEPGCGFHEPALNEASCGSCGACCREAYHEVPVGPEEPIRALRPDLVTAREGAFVIARPSGQCVALARDDEGQRSYACTIYEQRPQHCRDFEVGGPNCLEARQRVGLSGRSR